MRSLFTLAVMFIFCCLASCAMDRTETALPTDQPAVVSRPNRTPVLVELFTSEGCSSCPPADRNLAFLEKNQPVANADTITLAFHVDYWDRMGWKDRFSSHSYTQRQDVYASKLGSELYTPQMIVDGQTQFVGSDSGKATEEISRAVSASPKAPVSIVPADGGVKINIRDLPAHEDAIVYAVVAEDNISSRIGAGENSGMTIDHMSVVRQLMSVGIVAADKADFEGVFKPELPADSNVQNLRLVVFVQDRVTHRVLGIGRAPFTTAGK